MTTDIRATSTWSVRKKYFTANDREIEIPIGWEPFAVGSYSVGEGWPVFYRKAPHPLSASPDPLATDAPVEQSNG